MPSSYSHFVAGAITGECSPAASLGGFGIVTLGSGIYTLDIHGVARNIIDDGSGNMVVAGKITSQAGAGKAPVQLTYSFSFATGSATLAAGVTAFSVTAGDIITSLWLEIDTAFNGTTPLCDIGTFSAASEGLFYSYNSSTAIDLTAADAAATNNAGIYIGAATSLELINFLTRPLRITTTGPLTTVVSETGKKGGTAAGATAGAAIWHMTKIPA